jgi:hypothetical protein
MGFSRFAIPIGGKGREARLMTRSSSVLNGQKDQNPEFAGKQVLPRYHGDCERESRASTALRSEPPVLNS